MSILMTGLSVAKGVAIGKAYIMKHGQQKIPEYLIDESLVDNEIERYTEAVAVARHNLQKISKKISKNISANIADFIAAHIITLDEPAISHEPKIIIRAQKVNAEWALKKQSDELVKVFDDIDDPYLQSRKNDLLQATNMILNALKQQDIQPLEESEALQQRIIISEYLSPSDLTTLQSQNVIGFVSEHDAPNSHTAILARSLGIPVITGIYLANQYINDGELLLIDGKYGALCVNPDNKSIAHYQKLKETIAKNKQNLQCLNTLNSITLDHQPIKLYTNIGYFHNLEELQKTPSDGIGLYRTESIFQQGIFPDEATQFEIYRQLAEQHTSTTIRTLDLDNNQYPSKILKNDCKNSMLGLRAIRFSLLEPDIFLVQLRAILRASAFGKIRIVLPMVISLDEVLQAKKYIEQAKIELQSHNIAFDDSLEIGLMIETPALAFSLELFLNHIDFFAVGTNDLVQYLLAIDRSDEMVSYLYDPCHPAILNTINRIIKIANDNKKLVYLCGEMAGDTQYTRLLLGMGLRTFSVSPPQLLKVKQTIRQANIADAQLYVNEILKSSKSKRIKDLIIKLNNA